MQVTVARKPAARLEGKHSPEEAEKDGSNTTTGAEWCAYLSPVEWETISMVPVCSIQRLPTEVQGQGGRGSSETRARLAAAAETSKQSSLKQLHISLNVNCLKL